MKYQEALPIPKESGAHEFFSKNIQIEVFWVVTPCSIAVGYNRFGGLSP
jgi:hypothetical protein